MTDVEEPERSRKRLKPGERKLQILQAIAAMLEEESERITTAGLAARLQVSEAALYRHFASKAQMYEGLLEFIEQTIFGLINQIDSEPDPAEHKARSIVLMLLNFAETNPGMTRVLTGEALAYENLRLQHRVQDHLPASIQIPTRLQLLRRQRILRPHVLAAAPLQHQPHLHRFSPMLMEMEGGRTRPDIRPVILPGQ
jgi:AcrR family transcriptional regulator